jgi:hypothetical protein
MTRPATPASISVNGSAAGECEPSQSDRVVSGEAIGTRNGRCCTGAIAHVEDVLIQGAERKWRFGLF